MISFVQSLDLDDEDASYTIGQMMAHLWWTFDRQEYEKVGSLLWRRGGIDQRRGRHRG
uniref:Uncharacterized protein n=1 Tax=Kalanchoe fedtschenkoi TaxID=63787 RepID=A0A7N0RCU7_KALFE